MTRLLCESIRLEWCGSTSAASRTGQGEETTFAQIVAEEFGYPVENIQIVAGDTETTPQGWGTYGSRTTAVCGSAVKVAAPAGEGEGQEDRGALDGKPTSRTSSGEDGKFTVRARPTSSRLLPKRR